VAVVGQFPGGAAEAGAGGEQQRVGAAADSDLPIGNIPPAEAEARYYDQARTMPLAA
jgi:hypothetical protein